MNLLKSFAVAVLFVLFGMQLNAQSYTMTDGGSVTTCSGTFLDPGGTGNYAGGQNSTITYTICSGSGLILDLHFNSFSLFSNGCIWGTSVDNLTIYDGNSTSSPLIGTYENGDLAGQDIYGQSGCLTFQFTRQDNGGLGCSDNNGAPGWSAAISCLATMPATGDSCFDARPFCSDSSYNFPNSVAGNSAPVGPDYGCLYSYPDPVWYYMKIGTAGTLQLNLAQSNASGGLDVDFAMWGPFTSLQVGCNAVMGGQAPLQCSYSPNATETIGLGLPGGDPGAGGSTPPAAQVGQYYIVLITNYSEDPGHITLQQTAGTGATDCAIVNPCHVDSLSAAVSACAANNQYSVSGTIKVVNSLPTSGYLIVQDCNGNQDTVATAPFTDSIYTYTISGLPANGAPCTVKAYFTDAPTCFKTTGFIADSTPDFAVDTLNLSACNATDGEIFVTGTGSGSVSWSGPASGSHTGITLPDTIKTLGAGTYQVTYTSSSGCYTVKSVTLANPDAPQLDAINDTSSCGGSYTLHYSDIQGTNLSGNQAYYSATGGNPANKIPDGTVFTAPTDTTIYVYDNNGTCSNEVSFIIKLNVVPTISLNGGAICQGDTFTLAASATPTGGNYSWSNGENGSTILVSPTATESDTVTYTSADGCTAQKSATVTVNALPTPTATSNSPLCAGGNALNLNATGGTQYSWTGPDGFTSNIANPSINPTSTANSGIYHVIITNSDNCSVVDSVSVTIHPKPQATATSNSPVCAGNSLNLSATGGSNYSWTGPNGYTAIGINPSINPAATSNSGTYTVIVTNNYNCLDTASVTVVVSAGASSTINASICQGETYTLPDSSTGDTAGTYTIHFPMPSGCDSIVTVHLTVKPSPTIVTDGGVICSGQSFVLTTSAAPTGGTYSWDNGAGTGSSATVHPASTTVYTVTYTDSNGCVGSDTAIVTVNPLLPAPVITCTPVQNGNKINFSWNAVSGATGYEYSLDGGTHWISDSTGALSVVEPYTQSVILVRATGGSGYCQFGEIGQSAQCNYKIIVPNVITPNGDGKNDVFKIPHLSAYPNTKLVVYDRWGRKVYENENYQNNWGGGKLTDGSYMYILTLGNKDKTVYKGFLTILSSGKK